MHLEGDGYAGQEPLLLPTKYPGNRSLAFTHTPPPLRAQEPPSWLPSEATSWLLLLPYLGIVLQADVDVYPMSIVKMAAWSTI